MSTVQLIGIAVASAVVILLVIALIVTRRPKEDGETAEEPGGTGSFLDAKPTDTLSALGRPEQDVEEVTLDPEATQALREAAGMGAAAPGKAPEPADGRLGLDWGPSSSAPEPAATPAEQDLIHESGTGAAAEEPAGAAEGEPAAAEAAEESGSGGRLVPLSDIIVTTSSKMVDLQDPEVRRMLTDLVKFEIDQATQYRSQGQAIDAILQLTEAEKISRALGMYDAAARIHEMMIDVQTKD
jgi:hypothetical protein